MEISTEIGTFAPYGSTEDILRLVKNSGFTAYDFSLFTDGLKDRLIDRADYLEAARELRAFADSLGLKCNQSHAPFPSAKKGNEEFNEKTFGEMVRSLYVSGILGAKVCVIHPCDDYSAEENAVMYRRLEPYAREAGVKIGLENIWVWNMEKMEATPSACSDHKDFLKHLSLLDSDVFVACLDIGHAEMRGLNTSAVEMIKALGTRLQALHIHDNDKHRDKHELPYTDKINFPAIITALKESGYQGDVTLEASNFIFKLPVSVYPDAAKLMADISLHIKEQLQKF